MKILYYVESTALYGGTKVIFRQAEALARRGHQVAVVSTEGAPDWFEGRVDFIQASPQELPSMEGVDWIVGTYYLHLPILFNMEGIGPKLWHLSQGYEGGWPEAIPHLDQIEEAYRLPIPRLVISRELKMRLRSQFPGSYYVVGQGVEHNYFFPLQSEDKSRLQVRRVFLMGTYPAPVTTVETALLALRLAKERRGCDFDLVRITTSDTREIEEELFGPIQEYHVCLPPPKVGELLRGGGIMVCPNRAGEGFGLPAVEAMACGLPVVLSSIPSHMSFSNRRDYAIFVDPEDIHGMAQTVAELLGDSSLRRRLSKRGIEVASRFRFERVASRIEWWLRFRRWKERLLGGWRM